MYPPNLKSVALTVPEIRWVAKLQTPNLEKGEAMGSGMVPFERALVTFYRPSIVTFPLSLRVSRDIAAFVLQHATFSLPHL